MVSAASLLAVHSAHHTPGIVTMSEIQTEADTEEKLEIHLEDALEPNCRVIIHNDDITPFEFVIVILQRIFQRTSLEAEQIAFIAHTSGIAHVITLPCPEAHRRVGKAHFAASLDGYPLMFTVEPED